MESEQVQEFFSPLILQLSLGSILGFAIGFSFKKGLKILMIIIGIVFLSVQLLIAGDYINGVDWIKMGVDFQQTINSGLFARLWDFIISSLPFGTSFVIGFIYGLKKG